MSRKMEFEKLTFMKIGLEGNSAYGWSMGRLNEHISKYFMLMAELAH